MVLVKVRQQTTEAVAVILLHSEAAEIIQEITALFEGVRRDPGPCPQLHRLRAKLQREVR